MSDKNLPSQKLLDQFDQLIENMPGVERKGASMPYTSVNGNMSSFIDANGILSLRLSTEDREAFIKKYKSALSIQHGVVMKEYVSVPEKLFQKTAELRPWFERSFGYAQTLKPKPTKKK